MTRFSWTCPLLIAVSDFFVERAPSWGSSRLRPACAADLHRLRRWMAAAHPPGLAHRRTTRSKRVSKGNQQIAQPPDLSHPIPGSRPPLSDPPATLTIAHRPPLARNKNLRTQTFRFSFRLSSSRVVRERSFSNTHQNYTQCWNYTCYSCLCLFSETWVPDSAGIGPATFALLLKTLSGTPRPPSRLAKRNPSNLLFSPCNIVFGKSQSNNSITIVN